MAEQQKEHDELFKKVLAQKLDDLRARRDSAISEVTTLDSRRSNLMDDAKRLQNIMRHTEALLATLLEDKGDEIVTPESNARHAVLAVMATHPESTWAAPEIIEWVNVRFGWEHSESALRSAIVRATVAEEITNPARGTYQINADVAEKYLVGHPVSSGGDAGVTDDDIPF